jgi:hypothetical protein
MNQAPELFPLFRQQGPPVPWPVRHVGNATRSIRSNGAAAAASDDVIVRR